MTPPAVPGMVWVPGGSFTMGSDAFYPEEGPAHRVTVDGFHMDRAPVTNAQFTRFVAATGYVTVAERPPRAEDYPGVPAERLVPGAAVFMPTPGPVDLRDARQWWAYVPGADWRHPTGPGSTIDDKDDHPVVQVAYDDAVAYAAWAGLALPNEAEWECAARGGADGTAFAWGDERAPDGTVPANVWVGAFPWRSDEPWGTRPVGSFAPNGYGLFDMTGQVWEWTTDYWSARHTAPATALAAPAAGAVPSCCAPPTDPYAPTIALRVIKGGSFLCADEYCMRYRPAARISEAVDTATCHLGFRCVSRA
jgi:formylglycine-generating enzyme required for sulfatase activity